jgi:cytochrome c oxidase subunit 2
MKNALTLSGIISVLMTVPAAAQDGLQIIGAPVNGETGFQPAASSLARELQSLDYMILIIITAICVFVTALLAYAIVRFNRRANPNPASFTHNTPLEVAWTIIPIFILVLIGAFSLPVLFHEQEIPEGDITIKATGNQWYWSYEYVDHEFGFDSYMIGIGEPGLTDAVVADLEAAGYSRSEYLLATDTAVVVPVGKTIVIQVTAADVIHSWAMPSFGVKQDGVPGRLAELWFEADQEGIFFGQCSELCGKDHAYMPITVKVVSQEAYDEWLQGAIEEYAGKPLDYNVAARSE